MEALVAVVVHIHNRLCKTSMNMKRTKYCFKWKCSPKNVPHESGICQKEKNRHNHVCCKFYTISKFYFIILTKRWMVLGAYIFFHFVGSQMCSRTLYTFIPIFGYFYLLLYYTKRPVTKKKKWMEWHTEFLCVLLFLFVPFCYGRSRRWVLFGDCLKCFSCRIWNEKHGKSIVLKSVAITSYKRKRKEYFTHDLATYDDTNNEHAFSTKASPPASLLRFFCTLHWKWGKHLKEPEFRKKVPF